VLPPGGTRRCAAQFLPAADRSPIPRSTCPAAHAWSTYEARARR
jgi:hypothetical protein